MKDRKEEIIAATLELAAENGLGTISMQQIADKVGITKASLYNHFASRDEIVDAMYAWLRNASREKALRCFSNEIVNERIYSIYQKAMESA